MKYHNKKQFGQLYNIQMFYRKRMIAEVLKMVWLIVIIIMIIIWGNNQHVGKQAPKPTNVPTQQNVNTVNPCGLLDVVCDTESQGIASYYDYVLKGGWSSKGHYVAASRDYPRGSKVLVTNMTNGKSVVVTITDSGPNKKIFPERIIDLSSTAFSAISNLTLGIIKVNVEEWHGNNASSAK